MQHYADTAYGRAIGFDEATALTTRLYSGKAFDRFNRLDANGKRFRRRCFSPIMRCDV